MRVIQYFGLFLAVFGAGKFEGKFGGKLGKNLAGKFGGKLGKNLDGKLGVWWKKKFADGNIKKVAELSDDMKAKIAAKKEAYKQEKAAKMADKLEKGEITEEEFKASQEKAEKKFDFAAKKEAVKKIMEEKLANEDITPEQFDEWKDAPKKAAKKWKASVGKAKKALKKKSKEGWQKNRQKSRWKVEKKFFKMEKEQS